MKNFLLVVAALAGLLVRAPSSARAQEIAPSTQPYTRQLIDESDALIRSAVRRGYGWAWGEVSGESDPRATPLHVRMDAMSTPAAGLVLLWTSDLTGEARFKEASHQAARGVAAAMEGNGRVPSRAIFGRTPQENDESSVVPDRAATVAGLGLLLTLHARDQIPDERTRRAMAQAANWLLKQQSHAGAWPAAWPPDAERPDDAVRIIRLDTRDYRDSTLALLLAGDVLSNPQFERSAARAIDQLLRLRVEQRGRIGRGLWQAMYNLDGSSPAKVPDANEDVDILASRFAAQTLISGYVLTGNHDWGVAVNDAVKVFEQLRGSDGAWQRTYGAGKSAPASQPAIADIWPTGWFGVDSLLSTAEELKVLGRERFTTRLSAGFTVQAHLAQAATGLSDHALTMGFPLTDEEVEPYLKKNEGMWLLLDGPTPSDFPGRVQRLWTLYLRARIEQR